MSSAARMRCGCTSFQRQSAGTAAVPGASRMTRSHSGFMCRFSSSLENWPRRVSAVISRWAALTLQLLQGALAPEIPRAVVVLPRDVGGAFLGVHVDDLALGPGEHQRLEL